MRADCGAMERAKAPANRKSVTRENSRPGGISLKTLAVASAASATAAFFVPMIWAPGTIPAAAVMPVIVALITEALNRPTEHVANAATRLRAQRSTAPAAGAPADAAPIRRRGPRVAVISGMLAFAIVLTVWTATELAAGESITGSKRTTFFGGTGERETGAQPQPAEEDEQEHLGSPSAEPDIAPSPTVAPEPTASPTAAPSPSPAPSPPAQTVPSG